MTVIAEAQTAQATHLYNQVVELERMLSTRSTELQRFKEQVRDLIIDRMRSNTICRDGGNEALEELGLDRWSQYYTVRMTASVSVTVSADNEHDAGYEAEQGLAVRYEGYTPDDLYINVESVEENDD